MDPLTYIATGVVRDFGPWIVLIVGVAAVISVFAQVSLVMNLRRATRAVETLASAQEEAAAWVRSVAAREQAPITAPQAAAAK